MEPNEPMTPDEFYTRMLGIFPACGYDEEGAHQRADALMCELLASLGYSRGVNVFEDADKWHA